VALTLPLAAGRAAETPQLLRLALLDGAPDPSPNAGVSQAAYAHAAGIRLGGLNHYAGQARLKPLLAGHCPPPDREAVMRMLRLSDRLELLWLSPAAALLAWELIRALPMAAQ
jgi:adenosylcobinamide-phosphate synthase